MSAPISVYLDYQATTPVDPRVLEIMLPFFSEGFANPHSVQHGPGRDAADATDKARAQIAQAIGAEAREIVFTSGATEANNLAIKGAVRFAMALGQGGHIVTVATEHKCVLEASADMEAEGARVTVLPVGDDGLVDLGELESALDEETCLVSVMAVNNETGVIQPLDEIGAITRPRGILLHTDAAQAVGKIALDVEVANVDLMSMTAHKVYGPKGIGALYVRRRPRARLTPLFSGGGQERGLRSGTLPVPLCVGFGAACALAETEREAETARVGQLRDRLLAGLKDKLGDVSVNGSWERRIAANLNVIIPGADGGDLLAVLDDVAISTGSACTSASQAPSYVLTSMGLSAVEASQSFRLSVGRFTTDEEIDLAVGSLSYAATNLRQEPVQAAGD